MAQLSKPAAAILAAAPPLPFDAQHWVKIINVLKLSPKQAQVAELILRDLGDRQIAIVMGISASSIDTHMQRIEKRTGTKGRMQLAMHITAKSHEVLRMNCRANA